MSQTPSSAAAVQATIASWAQAFAREVQQVCPQARVYCVIVEEGLYDLWTVLPQRDLQVEQRIAEIECDLVLSHPDLGFDFMLITADSPAFSHLTASRFFPIGAA